MILSEEQRLLKDTIEAFLLEAAPVSQLRQLRDSKDSLGYSKTLWQQLIEMGIARTAMPEAVGGLGFGWLGMGAIMEACGRNLTASPLLSSVALGASLVELLGSDKQKQNLLGSIAEGQTTIALAIDEGYHFAPSTCETSVKENGDSYCLNGKKVFVIDGHSADQLLVVARNHGEKSDSAGLSLLIVDPNQSGVDIQRTHLMDGRNTSKITFSSVVVQKENLLGAAGCAWAGLETALNRGTACLAAEMLGGCIELFNRTIEYLQEREQFDAKIGSFQALQHRAAQMFCELESCKSAVANALASLDNNTADASLHVSLAKALLNDCYQHISNEAVQLHGGMGVTDELDIGLFLKRARVSMQLFGDTAFHQNRYASILGY